MKFKAEQRGQSSKLLSLSTELLLLILENVHTAGLLVLSKTSRRLHYLALPTYLSRHGINNPASRNLVLESRAVCALPGFQISLFITSLDHLSYKFKGVHPHFAREVNQLLRFVSRLTQVTEVVLDLRNIDSRWVDGLAIASSNFWKPDFIRLLMIILRKKCLSLTIARGRFLKPDVFSPPISKRHTITGGSTSTVTKFLGSPLWSAPRHGTTLHPLSPLNELCKLFIHADMLLSQPFYDWTMATLNTSRITSLSFRVSGIHPTTWATILSSLTIPTLTHFASETADIAFADLLKFLSRHPSIKNVGLHPHINRLDSGRLPRPVNRKRLLPNLASLSGSPGNIKHLLNYLRPVPHLESISLSLPVHQRPFQISDFEKLNSEIGAVMQNTKPLGLSLRFSVPFFCDDLSETRARKQGETMPSFHSVQSLNFSTDGRFDFIKWILPTLSNWLSETFPALHHVSFAGVCVPVQPELRDGFVHTISQHYCGIEIEIGEEDEVW
jgi:hypothetical protein